MEDALERHAPAPSVVLDPFAGVGTTLLEADLAGHEAVGFEINPYAAFVVRVKLAAHRIDARRLRDAVGAFSAFGETADANGAEPCSAPPADFRARVPFYSRNVLRKVLLTLDFIKTLDCPETADLFRLAFASTMVRYSNYSYEPSLGRKSTAGRPDVADFPVFDAIAVARHWTALSALALLPPNFAANGWTGAARVGAAVSATVTRNFDKVSARPTRRAKR